jgi:transcriptional regulator of acetoin/glycerol metabolism
LLKYGWPGNVRELENVIESAVVTTKEDAIDVADLPETLTQGSEGVRRFSTEDSLSDVEREHIRLVLEANSWNVKRSAEILGIDRTTLYSKMKKYGLKK